MTYPEECGPTFTTAEAMGRLVRERLGRTDAALQTLQAAYEEHLAAYPRLQAAARQAREAGASWGEIASACGVSRSTAQTWAE